MAMNAILNNRFWNKHSVKLMWGLAILFFFWVILSIAWNAWSQNKTKQANYQPQNVEPIAQTTRANYRVEDIIEANLFGDSTPAVAVVREAPETTLDLTLEGILWSSDKTFGRAIIVAGNRTAELYSVGEKIKGATAEVEEIRNGEIILNRNGVLESLTLLKFSESGNREIFSFSDETASDFDNVSGFDELSDLQQQNDRQQQNITAVEPRQVETTIPNSNSNQQQVRRPNFTGLDRALDKIRDL